MSVPQVAALLRTGLTALALLLSPAPGQAAGQTAVPAAPDWGYAETRYERVLAIHAASRRAVAGFGNRLVLLGWDSDRPLAWLPLPAGQVKAAKFSRDGRQLAVLAAPAYGLGDQAGGPRLYWFDVPSLRLRGSWEHGDTARLRFDPQGQRLASLDGNRICLYRLPQSAPACTRLDGAGGRALPITDLSFEDDAVWLLSFGYAGDAGDSFHQLWHWGKGEAVKRFEQRGVSFQSFSLRPGLMLELLSGRLREYALPALVPGPWRTGTGLGRYDGLQSSDDPGTLAIRRGSELLLIDYPELKPRADLGTPQAYDGDAVLLSGREGARVWSQRSGRPVSVPWIETGDLLGSRQSARAEADPERARLVVQFGDEIRFDWYDLRLGLRRDFANEAEYNYRADICFLPGRRELLALAYYGRENIINPDWPSYEQYDSVRSLTLIDPYGTRRPFAEGRYAQVVGGFKDTRHGVFAPGCGALALDSGDRADIWDLRSLRKRSVPFAGLYPEALSRDGNWLLGHDSAWEAHGLSLIDTRAGKRLWHIEGTGFWGGNGLFAQRHLVAFEALPGPQPAAPGARAPRIVMLRQALSLNAHPERWPLPSDMPADRIWLSGVSHDGRWTLLVHMPSDTSHELVLADWAQHRLVRLLPQNAPLRHFPDTGMLNREGGSQVWLAEGTRLLRWELPALKPLPALESQAAFPLIQALPDPMGPGILVIDQSGSLHRLNP